MWEAITASATQVELSRKSTQLDAMIRLFALWDSEEVMKSVEYVYLELDETINDPQFTEALKSGHQREQRWRPAIALQLWKHLRPVVELQRRTLDNPYLWKDTEWLAEEALKYLRKLIAENPRPRPSTGEVFKPEFLIETDSNSAAPRSIS